MLGPRSPGNDAHTGRDPERTNNLESDCEYLTRDYKTD
jgi:hypothetical protein